jgi:hypothetical protein
MTLMLTRRSCSRSSSPCSNSLNRFARMYADDLINWQMVCATSLKSSDNTRIPPSSSVSIDRSLNLIVFGVKEDRNADVWRRRVDDVLIYVTGKSIDVVDLFRLGRFNPDKTRPVLVKLRTVWDKRCILSKCMNLKHYTERGIFIAADDPVEVRRKNTFDRLKYRAEREGKSVSVVDGILSVEGI